MKQILLSLSLLLLSAQAWCTSRSFTAGTGNWDVATNWSPNGIPAASDDITISSGQAVTIPATYGATAANATIINGGTLTIAATGTLTINGTPSGGSSSGNAIYLGSSASTLTNNGSIIIGSTTAINQSGLKGLPGGVFNNTGLFQADRTGSAGISCATTVNNTGTIRIGSVSTIQTNGIYVEGGTFTNNNLIEIDNVLQFDGLGGSGTTINNGTVRIGSHSAIKRSTVSVLAGSFTNAAGAELQLDNIPATGNGAITMYAGSLSNAGTIDIGTNSSIINGVVNAGSNTFTNTGTINFGSNITTNGIGSGETVTNNSPGIIATAAAGLLKIAGTLVNNSTVTTNGTLTNNGTVTNNGTLKGNGTIVQNGTFTNTSTSHIAPGNSPGTLSVTGSFNLGSATLDIEVNGNTAGTTYDVLNISGTATIGSAKLTVTQDPGYTPSGTDVLVFLNAATVSGTFSTVTLPADLTIHYNNPSVGKIALTAAIALPVRLVAFAATSAGSIENRIDWKTGVEEANTTFSIQRSSDGSSLSAIGTVSGKGSNSTYTFYDDPPLPGTNYYRLKIMEASGFWSYSDVAIVRGDSEGGTVTIAPIPASSSIRITNTDALLTGQAAVIYNMQGAEVYRTALAADQSIDISGWAAGIYSLRLPTGEVLHMVKQ